MSDTPKYPWLIDSNERYLEVVRTLIGLSTASLVIPVFLMRDVFGVEPTKSIMNFFTCSVYASWISFGIAILSGIIFHYFSAKWIRMAWDQPAWFIGKTLSKKKVEMMLDLAFWISAAGFMFGLGFIIYFFASYVPAS